MPVVEHAVIAAAGLGSRLGLGRPKCLLELGGKTLLAHQLALLAHVPDVRIVVGFEEHQVMEAASAIRSDLVFVRNPAYRQTTTLTSYALGARGLAENCLYMDADIYFEPDSFAAFLKSCEQNPMLIGVTEAKTADAVYVRMEQGLVQGFTREQPQAYEWANLCWLPPEYCASGQGAVFERLSADLPLPACVIRSFEVDTPHDYANAQAHWRDIPG